MTITVQEIKNLMKKAGMQHEGLSALIQDKADTHVLDLIDRNDYFATTLWHIEDITNTMQEMESQIPSILQPLAPVHAKQDAILEHINFHELKSLGDCTDEDWDKIRYAIYNSANIVMQKSNKTRYCTFYYDNDDQTPGFVDYVTLEAYVPTGLPYDNLMLWFTFDEDETKQRHIAVSKRILDMADNECSPKERKIKKLAMERLEQKLPVYWIYSE